MSKYLSLSGLIAVCLIGLSWTSTFGQEEKKDKPAEAQAAPKLDMAALEKNFEKTMSGCALVGKFTVVGRENANPREERYVISKCKKQEDGEWIFVYKYGDKGSVIPIKLKVEWAGDTPVITLTDLSIAGAGPFSARVLVYQGWYAGTWKHGEHGGHMYGVIEKLPEEPKKKKDSEKSDDAKKEDDSKK